MSARVVHRRGAFSDLVGVREFFVLDMKLSIPLITAPLPFDHLDASIPHRRCKQYVRAASRV